jgi:hypothetical protein
VEWWNNGLWDNGVVENFFLKDASKECIKMKNSLFEIDIPTFQYSIIPLFQW